MSALVTEPNSRPSTPAFCVILTVIPSSFAAFSWATVSSFRRRLLELGTLRFEQLDVLRGRALRLALRDQEIARNSPA